VVDESQKMCLRHHYTIDRMITIDETTLWLDMTAQTTATSPVLALPIFSIEILLLAYIHMYS